MNITSGPDLTIDEVSEAASTISESAQDDAQIYFGTVFDPDAGDELRITVIATGIEKGDEQAQSRSVFDQEAKVTPIQGQQKKTEEGQSQRSRKPAPAQNSEDRNIPAYLRKGSNRSRDGSEELSRSRKAQNAPEPGEEEFIFDEQEFEIPSFIRKQAD